MSESELQKLRWAVAFWRNERDIAERYLAHAHSSGIGRAKQRAAKAQANFDQATQQLQAAEPSHHQQT